MTRILPLEALFDPEMEHNQFLVSGLSHIGRARTTLDRGAYHVDVAVQRGRAA